jgi:hypothetical protein
MNHNDYEAFLERIAEEAWPCKYGHINCSDRQGGVCSDEEALHHDGDDTDEG